MEGGEVDGAVGVGGGCGGGGVEHLGGFDGAFGVLVDGGGGVEGAG